MSTSIETMIIGRILQGIGLAAPYTLSISIVRDSYKGDYLGKIMSFIMVIFILVPVIAPALGKLILDSFNWKAIFIFQIIFSIIIIAWFWKRQPETLLSQNRSLFKPAIYSKGIREFFKFKDAVGFTIIMGFLTGAFMVYISASQHIFENQYGLKEEFPYIFASIALTIGISTFLNGMLVMKYGMYKLSVISLIAFCLISIVYVALFWGSQNPPLVIFIFFMAIQFFALGFLFGNARALSMEPLGHIAGIGASISGFLSTLIAVPIGIIFGRFIETTALPMFFSFAFCGTLSLLIFALINKYRKSSLKKV